MRPYLRPIDHIPAADYPSAESLIDRLKELAAEPPPEKDAFLSARMAYIGELLEELITFRNGREAGHRQAGRDLLMQSKDALVDIARQHRNASMLLCLGQALTPQGEMPDTAIDAALAFYQHPDPDTIASREDHLKWQIRSNRLPTLPDRMNEQALREMRDALRSAMHEMHDLDLGWVTMLAYRYRRFGDLLHGVRKTEHDFDLLMAEQRLNRQSIPTQMLGELMVPAGAEIPHADALRRTVDASDKETVELVHSPDSRDALQRAIAQTLRNDGLSGADTYFADELTAARVRRSWKRSSSRPSASPGNARPALRRAWLVGGSVARSPSTPRYYQSRLVPLGGEGDCCDVVVVGSNRSYVVVSICKNDPIRWYHAEQKHASLLRLSILARPHIFVRAVKCCCILHALPLRGLRAGSVC